MKYIERPKLKELPPPLRAVYADVKKVFGAVPEPFMAHGYDGAFLNELWTWTRLLYFDGRVGRKYKDIIAGAVSKANECPFCLEAHSLLVKFTDRQARDAILSGEVSGVEDDQASNLIEWGFANLRPDADIVRRPPFGRQDLPEIIFTALTYHYMNRFVAVFFDGSPFPVAPVPGLKNVVLFALSPMMKKLAHLTLATRDHEAARVPGTPSTLKTLAPDLGWAQDDPRVLKVVTGASKSADVAGEAGLSAPVRDVVLRQLRSWNGQPPPFGSDWLSAATKGLSEDDQKVARLCLLVALCPYRITQGDVTVFRNVCPEDADLVRATIWSSFRAARRIAEWLAPVRLKMCRYSRDISNKLPIPG